MNISHIPQKSTRITEIYAYISVDLEGNEAFCAFARANGVTLPMITADPAKLEEFEPVAKNLARINHKPVRLVKFSIEEEIRQIEA